MSVQDVVRTVTVPRQAEPVDRAPAPLATTASEPDRRTGRDRPLSEDERQFLIGLAVLLVGLGGIIVTFLLLAVYVWS